MCLVYTYISNSRNLKVISEVLVLKENKQNLYTSLLLVMPHLYKKFQTNMFITLVVIE